MSPTLLADLRYVNWLAAVLAAGFAVGLYLRDRHPVVGQIAAALVLHLFATALPVLAAYAFVPLRPVYTDLQLLDMQAAVGALAFVFEILALALFALAAWTVTRRRA